MSSELHLREAVTAADAARPRVKPPPQSTAISAPFDYSPSDDGTDENLLVLLHGLGPQRPFFFFSLGTLLIHPPLSAPFNIM